MKWQRVLLKLSGEALAPASGFGIDDATVSDMAEQIVELHHRGYELAIVVGGGNFWRGRSSENMDRSTADYMGMLATVINGLALQDAIEELNVPTRVMSAIEMPKVAEPYIRRRAVSHLQKRRIVIFSGGTGNPFFSTDTTAALRAAEVDAQLILFAKTIDGVYDKDPKSYENARKFDRMTYKEILDLDLQVMDQTAATLLRENNIPCFVFSMKEEQSLIRALESQTEGTMIRREHE
ncbi:MAG TPA: UMP kinase [Tissierellia bacterium]|jgi:uridylate kinase|nr:UMP kinase [Tissierellia bacterium]